MQTKIIVKHDYAVIEFDRYMSRNERRDTERTIKEQNKQVKVVFFRHLMDRRYKTTKH